MSGPAPRRPRAAAGSRPIPALDVLAATLAAGSLAALPFAARLFPDRACADPPPEGSAAAAIAQARAHGVFAEPGAPTHAAACPSVQTSPFEMLPMGVEASVGPEPPEPTVSPGGLRPATPEPLHRLHRRGERRPVGPTPPVIPERHAAGTDRPGRTSQAHRR